MKKLFFRAVSAIRNTGSKMKNLAVTAVAGAGALALSAMPQQSHAALDTTAALAEITSGIGTVEAIGGGLLLFSIGILVIWTIVRKTRNG